MKMSKLTAAYLAGLIDGEGTISVYPYIRKDRDNQIYYKPNFSLTLTDKRMIEWMKSSFGGYIWTKRQDNPKWKDSYRWSLSNSDLNELLIYVHPYLRLKKKQCELVLERIRISKHRKMDCGASYVPSTDKWRAYMYKSGKQLNLGCYESKEKALEVRKLAIKKANPNFTPVVSQDNTRIVEIYNELRKLNKTGPSLYAERLTEMTSQEEVIV